MFQFIFLNMQLQKSIISRRVDLLGIVNWGFTLLGMTLAIHVQSAAAESTPVPTKKIESIVLAYANSIGCNATFDKNNIAKLPESYGVDRDGYVVIFYVDVGCEGGSTSEQSVFAVLIQNDREQFYIAPQFSAPDSTIGFPRDITSVFAKDGSLWYIGKDYDFSKDALCCPSIAVRGKLSLKKISSTVGDNTIDLWYWTDQSRK